MLNKLHRRARDEKGFTLIELLVVILIIGILAAIALPAFLGQRTKGQDSAAKSDVRNMVSQIESFYTDGDTYVGFTGQGSGIKVGTAGGQVQIVSVSKDAYTLKAYSDSGNTFSISRTAGGELTRTCTVKAGGDKGGCGAAWTDNTPAPAPAP